MTRAADWDQQLAEEEPLMRKRDRGVDVEMDITPMIDITFLLLIFFVVCSIPDQDSAVDLPQAKYGKGVSQKNSVIITLSDEGADAAPIYLADGKDGEMLPEDVDVQREMIQEAVEKGRLEDQKENVLIKADRNVAYRDVEKVIKAVSRVEGAKIYLGVLDAN